MTSIPFISLDERSSDPIYRQIYKAIRNAILTGDFQSGLRLPASRLLADQLGVSRMTVINAYEQLFAEGYLEGKPGAGTYVASHLPEEFLQPASAEKEKDRSIVLKRKVNLSEYGSYLNGVTTLIKRNHGSTDFVPFQHGLTAVDQFPFDVWSRIVQHYYKYPKRELLGNGDPEGLPSLRKAIAVHLRSSRGVICEPEQVIVTSGAQQALSLIARLLVGAKDTVWMEDPGYLGARDILLSSGAKVVPIPVDNEGINIAKAPVARSVKIIYVTPSHQFPLGGTLTLPRRLNLLELGRDKDAWIIEDDYDSEFRYAGRPLSSLQGLDRDNRVIYVGTFGKTLFPSLRLGCMVVPQDLIQFFAAARSLTDLHSSLIDQAVLAEFIAEGHFARHLRRMRKLYAERQAILIHEIEKNLEGFLEVSPANAGMHLVGWLPNGVDDELISKRLKEKGVNAAPLSKYAVKRPKRGALLLGYTAFDKRQIRSGAKILRSVLDEQIT